MLREQLDADLKEALRHRHAVRLSVIRQVKAAILAQETRATRTTLDEAGIQAVIAKEIRERRDAIDDYARASRDDLVAKAHSEIEELSRYLPPPLSTAELKELVERAVTETGAASLRDMGKVMAKLVADTRGRADGRELSEMVKARLGEGSR